MADEKLRELERRWKETQSIEDEAAYLLERVRTGDLEKERLELAAYCGHEAARVALGDEAPEVPGELEEWGEALVPRWGSWCAIAFVHAVAQGCLEVWDARSDDPGLRKTSDAILRWLGCPCDEHVSEAEGVGIEEAERCERLALDALDRAAVWAASTFGTLARAVGRTDTVWLNRHGARRVNERVSRDLTGALLACRSALGEESFSRRLSAAALARVDVPKP